MSAALELMLPAFHNVYLNKNALETYEAIAKHADEINKGQKGFYFALAQRFALDFAVIGICKLYDKDERTHSVYALFKFFADNFSVNHISKIRGDELCGFGLSNEEVAEYAPFLADAYSSLSFDKSKFAQVKERLIAKLYEQIPSKENNAALKTLFGYRDKFVAHQERVKPEVEQQYKNVPSLDELEKLNAFAHNMCRLIGIVFDCGFVVDSVQSGFVATCNVIAKVLDVDFEDSSKALAENYKARELFYEHLH